MVTSKTLPRYLGGTHYIMGVLVTSKMLLRYLSVTHYIISGLVTCKTLKWSVQIDEAITFMDQSLMRMRV